MSKWRITNHRKNFSHAVVHRIWQLIGEKGQIKESGTMAELGWNKVSLFLRLLLQFTGKEANVRNIRLLLDLKVSYLVMNYKIWSLFLFFSHLFHRGDWTTFLQLCCQKRRWSHFVLRKCYRWLGQLWQYYMDLQWSRKHRSTANWTWPD